MHASPRDKSTSKSLSPEHCIHCDKNPFQISLKDSSETNHHTAQMQDPPDSQSPPRLP